MKLKDIIEKLEQFAPLSLCENWDNSGLMAGSPSAEIKTCYVALDINDMVIDYAKNHSCDLIVTHHPFLMSGLKSVNLDDPKGAQLARLLQSGINVYSMHTNFDSCQGGVNDILCETLALSDYQTNDAVMYRTGTLPRPMMVSELCAYIKEILSSDAVRFTGSPEKLIRTLTVLGGAGGGFLSELPDSDAYLTGEAKYHEYQEAQMAGITMLTAGHFETEAPALEKIRQLLSDMGLTVLTEEVYKGFYQTV